MNLQPTRYLKIYCCPNLYISGLLGYADPQDPVVDGGLDSHVMHDYSLLMPNNVYHKSATRIFSLNFIIQICGTKYKNEVYYACNCFG